MVMSFNSNFCFHGASPNSSNQSYWLTTVTSYFVSSHSMRIGLPLESELCLGIKTVSFSLLSALPWLTLYKAVQGMKGEKGESRLQCVVAEAGRV